MTEKIALFYIVMFTILIVLNIFYRSKLSQLAFIWFGPIPTDGEFLSDFKLRKVRYALSWLLQFIYAFSIIFVLAVNFSWVEDTMLFMVFVFAFTIGVGMALFATIGFFISWLKTRVFGPDGRFELVEVDELEA
ncbi:hypothetical protein [Shewanella sp. WPAGA9]|uniref:hypothetical protein n=1 Tax=Shewanella sp. ENK2 TaxID=2775245 RepID=UPI00178405EE|nr:hypothetical protein [Shewanella sp. WPAGA9]